MPAPDHKPGGPHKALVNDVDGYLTAVRKHEMLHCELMQKSLAENDPSPKVEAFSDDATDKYTSIDMGFKGK